MEFAVIATPIGHVRVEAEADHLTRIAIAAPDRLIAPSSQILTEACRQLAEYFARDRLSFHLPLAPAASPRGEALRAGIAAIPYGETLSYGALARLLESGPRAIGQACARNPFPIVIPCHRVLGGGGAIGHYSGGEGIVTKRALLAHESKGKDFAWAA